MSGDIYSCSNRVAGCGDAACNPNTLEVGTGQSAFEASLAITQLGPVSKQKQPTEEGVDAGCWHLVVESGRLLSN